MDNMNVCFGQSFATWWQKNKCYKFNKGILGNCLHNLPYLEGKLLKIITFELSIHGGS